MQFFTQYSEEIFQLLWQAADCATRRDGGPKGPVRLAGECRGPASGLPVESAGLRKPELKPRPTKLAESGCARKARRLPSINCGLLIEQQNRSSWRDCVYFSWGRRLYLPGEGRSGSVASGCA